MMCFCLQILSPEDCMYAIGQVRCRVFLCVCVCILMCSLCVCVCSDLRAVCPARVLWRWR